jgi:hypothetical protein
LHRGPCDTGSEAVVGTHRVALIALLREHAAGSDAIIGDDAVRRNDVSELWFSSRSRDVFECPWPDVSVCSAINYAPTCGSGHQQQQEQKEKEEKEKGKVATLIRSKSLLKLDPMDGWMDGRRERSGRIRSLVQSHKN